MSQSYPPQYKPMPPITLRYNLLTDLETALRAHGITDIIAYLSKYGVRRGIAMFFGVDGIFGEDGSPARKYETVGGKTTSTIALSEPFISWVWICSYFLLVQRQQALNTTPVRSPLSPRALNTAAELKDYGETLFHNRVEWPAALPSPENVIDELRDIIEQSNALYLAAMQFILLHELGHAVLGHVAAQGPLNIEQEKEADDYAIDIWQSLAATATSGRQLHTLQQGACIAFLALVFIPAAMAPSSSYPPIEQRLDKLMHVFELVDNSIIWYMAAQCLQYWCAHKFQNTLEADPNVGTARDYYNAVQSHLSELVA